MFVLGGVVGGVWNESVSECRFSVHGKSPVCRGPMDGDVKEVYLVVCLAFHCELECRVYCVEHNTPNTPLWEVVSRAGLKGEPAG